MTDESDFSKVSKTRRKQQMHELQSVGKMLVKLSPEKLARIHLPEALREAVADAQRMTKHEAVRRQMQYIGRLMRDVDAEPIVEQLNALEAPSRKQTAIFHVAERWRLALIDDPAAVSGFVKEFPEADADRLKALALDAAEEKRTGRPPRQFRELFHVLNAILQDHSRKPS
jgi:ribosome-associated protein